MYYRKFRFKKDFVCPDGTIREGSDIIIINDVFYFNGGLVNPAYKDILVEILNTPKIAAEYLVEMIPNPEAYNNNL